MEDLGVIELVRAAVFSDFFINIEKVSFDKITEGITTEFAIDILCRINTLINSKSSIKETDFNVVDSFVMNFPWDVKKYVYNVLNEMKDQNNGRNSIVFTRINTLYVLQKILMNNNRVNIVLSLKEQYVRIFQAILLTNETLTKKKANTLIKDENEENDTKFICTFLPSYFPDSEFFNTKDLVVQSIKLFYFIDFVEKDLKFSEYIEAFMKDTQVPNWKKYLKFIFLLYANMFKSNGKLKLDQKNYILDINEHIYPEDAKYFNNIALSPQKAKKVKELLNEHQEYDFKLFRKYPLIKIAPNKYAIPNVNFLADKVFQSIQFDFADAVRNNGGKDYGDGFKAYYSENFTHKYLFHKIMDYCFNEKYDLVLKGDQEKVEYSDYYIRKGNKIMLFELKDHVMNAKVKHSYNFNLIYKDIISNFVDNPKKPKGIRQILNVIKNLSSIGYKFDDFYKQDISMVKKLVINPIIVYTDSTYDCPGVNYILNKEFNILTEKETFLFKINEIVIINLDFLIKFQDDFHEGRLNLLNLVNSYIRYINKFRMENIKSRKIDDRAFEDFSSYFSKIVLSENSTLIKKENPLIFRKMLKEVLSEN